MKSVETWKAEIRAQFPNLREVRGDVDLNDPMKVKILDRIGYRILLEVVYFLKDPVQLLLLPSPEFSVWLSKVLTQHDGDLPVVTHQHVFHANSDMAVVSARVLSSCDGWELVSVYDDGGNEAEEAVPVTLHYLRIGAGHPIPTKQGRLA